MGRVGRAWRWLRHVAVAAGMSAGAIGLYGAILGTWLVLDQQSFSHGLAGFVDLADPTSQSYLFQP